MSRNSEKSFFPERSLNYHSDMSGKGVLVGNCPVCSSFDSPRLGSKLAIFLFDEEESASIWGFGPSDAKESKV